MVAASCGNDLDLSPDEQRLFDQLSDCSQDYLRDLDELGLLDSIGPLITLGMGMQISDPGEPDSLMVDPEDWVIAAEAVRAAGTLRDARARDIVQLAFVGCADSQCSGEGLFWYALGQAIGATMGSNCESQLAAARRSLGVNCGCDQYTGFRRLSCVTGEELGICVVED